MKASIRNIVLASLLFAVGTSSAIADASGQTGSSHAESVGEIHLTSTPTNRLALQGISKTSARVSSLFNADSSLSRAVTNVTAGGDETATSRQSLPSMSLQFRKGAVEETVRQFHREGLPIARLWQSESSALNLGLNPKGKPGLWFVKRLP